MDIIEEKYVEKLQNGIMGVVKQWCSGASFKQISEDSGIFEGLLFLSIFKIFPLTGSIIRCLRRLEELLREMTSAVKAMTDSNTAKTFEDASKSLKRDIVFAASLYL
jgi:superfamily II RNA helicase